MRPIPAEDSIEERGSSEAGSNTKEGEDEEEGVEEEAYESDNRMDDLDERDKIKKEIKQKEQKIKEQVEMCGPRLTKKIDDFVFSLNVEAGLNDQNFAGEASSTLNQATMRQKEMLETGNTSIFQLEKDKNDDQGVHEKVMEKYV